LIFIRLVIWHFRGFFTELEIRRVMAHLPAELADFVLFGWLTGMRRKEMRSLLWENVVGDEIRLEAKSAKTGEGRVIPLESELAELIQRRRTARQVKRDGIVTMSPWIFHRNGEPIKDFHRPWLTACRLAGVNRLFHDLRRSACRNMLLAGVPQAIAMQISGHKTTSMFQRYAIVAPADVRQALRKTQEYLANNVEEDTPRPPATIN
jgi:integrase